MKEEDIRVIKPDALAPAEILAKAEQIGIAKVNNSGKKTFLLAIMAGMFISMGGMFMFIVKADATLSFAVSQIAGGLAFCLGLFLVVVAGAELFTGNTLIICGSLSKKCTIRKMLKNWVIVYLGNFVGSLIMVAILFFSHYSAVNGGAVGDAMLTVATSKVSQTFDVLLFKGIMCNFLVCLAVWISYASRTVVDKFVGILLPITAFVACGFEHCIANMFFLPMGFLLKVTGFDYTGTADLAALNIPSILHNLGAVTIGNILGGMVLVGTTYWLAYHKKETAKG